MRICLDCYYKIKRSLYQSRKDFSSGVEGICPICLVERIGFVKFSTEKIDMFSMIRMAIHVPQK